MDEFSPTLPRLTADVVCAYVARNAVPVAAVPDLIRTVHAALRDVVEGKAATPTVQAEPASAAAIRKSVTPDALISFIDGKRYKTLRRHLTAHGLTPEQYRRAFGLSHDYPLVAPSYAKRRSDLAKAIGLGVPGSLARAA